METATKVPLSHFSGWLAMGERGLSSEFIVSHLTGTPSSGPFFRGVRYPLDPADFRRCQLLLRSVPTAALSFPAMRTASPEWERLVDAWDEIHEAIEAEVPGYLDGASNGWARAAYRLMKRVIAGGESCQSCEGTGNAEACSKCKGTGRRSGGRCRAVGCIHGFHSCGTCRGEGFVR